MTTQKQNVSKKAAAPKKAAIKKTIEPKSNTKVSAKSGGIVKTIWQLLNKSPKLKAKELSAQLAAKNIEHSMSTCYRQRWEYSKASQSTIAKMIK